MAQEEEIVKQFVYKLVYKISLQKCRQPRSVYKEFFIVTAFVDN